MGKLLQEELLTFITKENKCFKLQDCHEREKLNKLVTVLLLVLSDTFQYSQLQKKILIKMDSSLHKTFFFFTTVLIKCKLMSMTKNNQLSLYVKNTITTENK